MGCLGGRFSRAETRALALRFCRSSWLLTTTRTDRPTNFLDGLRSASIAQSGSDRGDRCARISCLIVWRPKDFSDIEAAIDVIAEGPDLDFKRDLSKATDIAKDIASMSIQGGVIAYGIDEDPQTTVARAITAISLRQVGEKIQNIADTAIWPSPGIAIQRFTRQPDDPDGVVLVTVAASPLAPHYTHDRFPARSGTTTRNLTEREISALYDQRKAALASTDDREILADFQHPADAANGLGFGGIGMLRLLVAPLLPASHPQGVRLARPLAAAVAAAKESTASLFPASHTAAFDLIKDWTPRGAIGWQAGTTFDNFERLRNVRTAAAVCTHDLAMSFYATINLTGEDGVGRCAYEQLWAAATIALLSIAGHFFQQVPTTSILRAELGMQGFDNAVSYAASQGLAFQADQLRATDGYNERTQTSPAEIANEPVTVAKRLLDRFFVSFVPESSDTFIRLQSTL